MLVKPKYVYLAVVLIHLKTTVAFGVVLSDRDQDHVVAPGQASYGLNLDGVALLGTDAPSSSSIEDILVPRCNGALITDRHVLSAAHCFDEDEDGTIDFQIRSFPVVAGFELPDRDVLIRVNTDSIHMPSGWPTYWTDIAVLELAEPAPLDIPRYPLYGLSDEISKPIVVVGYGATGYGDTGIDEVASETFIKRAGLNRIETFFDERELELGFDFDSGDEAHNAFPFLGVDSDLGFGMDEVLTSQGDSGGPAFVYGAVAGVNAFNAWLTDSDFNDEFDQSWGEVAFATRVSSFQDFILTATNGEAVFLMDDGDDYDFDGNGAMTSDDIDALVRQIIAVRQGNKPNLAFDVTQDGSVDTHDRDEWLSAAATTNGFADSYFLGDANLDGNVDAQDLNALGQNWLGHPNIWSLGDFNADGTVDVSDLNKIGQNWLGSIPMATTTQNVPESRSWNLLAIILAYVAFTRRQHSGIFGPTCPVVHRVPQVT